MSVVPGTMLVMANWRTIDPDVADVAGGLRWHTGAVLSRPVAFRFALDVTGEQHELLLRHAGAARFAYNHHLGRVRANLEQRRAEASYGIAKPEQTPALSWSKVSFINSFNAWKTGRSRRQSAQPGRVPRPGLAQRSFAGRVRVRFRERRAGAGELLGLGDRRPQRQEGRLPAVQVPAQEHPGVQAAVEIQAWPDRTGAGRRGEGAAVSHPRRAASARLHQQGPADARGRPAAPARRELPLRTRPVVGRAARRRRRVPSGPQSRHRPARPCGRDGCRLDLFGCGCRHDR